MIRINPRFGNVSAPIPALIELLSGKNEEAQRQANIAGLCPACDGKIDPDDARPLVEKNRVALCPACLAMAQMVTRRGELSADGRVKRQGLLQHVLRAAVWKLMGRAEDCKNALPPEGFVRFSGGRDAPNGKAKTNEQVWSESLYGGCPFCEKQHRFDRLARHTKNGQNKKVIFCSECRDIYTTTSKWCRALASQVVKEVESGKLDISKLVPEDWGYKPK